MRRPDRILLHMFILTISVFLAIGARAALYPALDIEPEFLLPPEPQRPSLALPPPSAKPGDGPKYEFLPSRFKKIDIAGKFRRVLFASDPSIIAVQRDSSVELYDLQSGASLVLHDLKSEVFALAFNRDGSLMAAGAKDKHIHIFDRSGFRKKMKVEASAVASLAFNNRGSVLAAGFEDGHIELWNVEFGELEGAFKAHSGRVHSLAFMPGDAVLVTSAEDLLTKFWDIGRKKETRSFRESTHKLFATELSSDGGLIVLNTKQINIDLMRNIRRDDRYLIVRSTETGAEVGKFKLPEDVTAMALYPEGRYLASATADMKIRVFDYQDGAEVNEFEMSDRTASLSFSPDGGMLAFGGKDAVVILRMEKR